jgi:hypothetical protein
MTPKTVPTKPMIPLTDVIDSHTPEELKDPNTIIMLYLLFGIDEVLLGADPKAVPERVWDALADVTRELNRIPKPNLKSAAIKLHAAVDSVECALGPRDGEDDGSALVRLRKFEQLVAQRRGLRA